MSEVSRKTLLRAMLVMLVCFTMSFAAMAQSTTDGAIGGTVTDVSKAIVPGAKVTVVNIGTNDTKSMVTDNEGKFRVLHLQPGAYTVTVEAASFAGHKRQGVIVEIGRVTELDVALTAGTKTETVEVISEAPMINTVQQDFSHNINQAQINELPINGRRWSNFALLTPGAAPDGDFGLISFRGISGLLNNNTVDGGDNNQAFFSEERGRTRISYVVSQAAVQEFQVNTSNFSAEYGRAAGAVVNAVTKSGTNKMHGSVFYYIRDNELGAMNPNTFVSKKNAAGTYVSTPFKPEDRRQQFGGNLGGAIKKDKVFFFLNYDQQKRNYPGIAGPNGPGTMFADPSAADLTAFKGKFAANFFADDTAAKAAYNLGRDYLASLSGPVARKGDQTIIFPKLDWKITPNNTLALSYNRMRWNSPAGVQSQPFVNRAITSWGDDGVKVDSFTARMSSAVRNNISNEFRFQYGRDFEFQYPQKPVAGEPLTSINGLPPQMRITSNDGMYTGTPDFLARFAYPEETRMQFADTLNYVTGKHLIKVGTDINKVNERINNLFQGNGAYSYSSRTDFFADFYGYKYNLGNPVTPLALRNYSSYGQAYGYSNYNWDSWDLAWFIQDDWRILPRLTLNIGARYEYQVMPHPVVPNTAIPETLSFHHDSNNIGPRIGFAWDMFGDGKTSLRGGYGVYFGRVINAQIDKALTQTGAPGSQLGYSLQKGDVALGAPLFPYPLGATTATVKPTVVYLNPELESPRIQQVDAVLEREIARNTTLSLSYLGSFGSKLVRFFDHNLPAVQYDTVNVVGGGPYDGTYKMPVYRGKRPNAAYGAIVSVDSAVDSNYNALVAQVSRRMTNGLQFNTSFTWSHAIDGGQNSTTNGISSPNILDQANEAQERGTSNFDMRKRFVGSVVWAPQFFKNSHGVVKALLDNWSISPIVTIATGKPFTEYVGGGVSTPNTPNCSTVQNGAYCSIGSGPVGSGASSSRLFFLSRNQFRFPRTELVDLRISKRVQIKEGQKVEFLAEAFNLFNRRNPTQIKNELYRASTTWAGTAPNQYPVYTYTYQATGGFGTPSEYNNTTIYRERQIQFALRYEF